MAVLAVMFVVSIRIYDLATAGKINPVLFQPAALWQNRIDAPVPLENMADEYIKNRLLIKFVTEYLQVIPSEAEINARSANKSVLALQSSPDVMDKWRRDVLPNLREMAGKRQMRRIIIDDRKISKPGDFYVVPFTTATWTSSSSLDVIPEIINGGEMHLKIHFNKKVRDMFNGQEFDAGKYMDAGFPPAAIFEFVVIEAVIR